MLPLVKDIVKTNIEPIFSLLETLRSKTAVTHTNSTSSIIPECLLNETNTSLATPRTRSVTGNTIKFKNICFICNIKRSCDQSHPYNEGCLGVCQFESAADRLTEAANVISISHECFHAKERLQILLSGQSTDIFSAEVRYHSSCYKRFISY